MMGDPVLIEGDPALVHVGEAHGSARTARMMASSDKSSPR
jgi:hypothetical protein